MPIYKLFFLFLIFSFSFGLVLRTAPSLKYQNLAPSLVYQLICNGTESRVLSKTKAILSYADGNLADLLKKQTLNSQQIIQDCENKYWTMKCDQNGTWLEEIDDTNMKIRYIQRNISEINDNLEDIKNETDFIDRLFCKKIKNIKRKLHQKKADLDLIEEVEKLIKDGLVSTNNGSSFVENQVNIMKKKLKKLKGKNVIKGEEIGEEILGILREVKNKLIRGIKKLKLRKRTYEKAKEAKMLEFSREKADNEEKYEELEGLLADTQREEKRLEERVKTCERFNEEKNDYCSIIQSNSTVFLGNFEQEMALLDELTILFQ